MMIDVETADRLRIQAHLQRVETELRARDVSHLAPAPRAARLHALDVLHEYRLTGRFPRNRGEAPDRIPIFIDADGRTCAVAELIFQSGAAKLKCHGARTFPTCGTCTPTSAVGSRRTD